MRSVVVDTNLAEEVEYRGKSFTRHARSRFVERPKEPEPSKPPQLGDPWCPLTVRARLHRFAEVFRRIPHTPDTKPGGYRSCMPDVVRELWKDQPKDKGLEAIRLVVDSTDRTAAFQLLTSLISFKFDRDKFALWWGIANKLSARRVARELRCDHKTVSTRMLKLLEELSIDWNRRGWATEAADIAIAEKLIHRNRD